MLEFLIFLDSKVASVSGRVGYLMHSAWSLVTIVWYFSAIHPAAGGMGFVHSFLICFTGVQGVSAFTCRFVGGQWRCKQVDDGELGERASEPIFY